MDVQAQQDTICAHCNAPLSARTINRGGKYCSYDCFQAERAAQVELVDRVCEHCGKEFRARASQVANGQWKCCSKECKDAITHKNPQRECETCSQPFWPRSDLVDRGAGRFCSQTCAGAAKRNRVELVCARCGTQFDLKASKLDTGRGVYCSKACQQPMLERDCEVCATTFRTNDSQQLRGWGRFCSMKCRSTARFGRPRVWLDRTCAVCGIRFQATESTVEDGGGKYCSVACRGVNRRNRVAITCLVCGTDFSMAISRSSAKFCSKVCMTEWQRSDPGWKTHVTKMRHDMLTMRTPTRCEVVLYDLMNEVFGDEWSEQWLIGYWTVDAAVPDLKLVVQADGDYWHGYSAEDRLNAVVRGNVGNDKRCDAYCEKHGWTVLRLWEHDLLKNPEECAERIRAAVVL